jgi:hypothetical protein
MSALDTTAGDLASVLSTISQQMVEGVPIGVLRECLKLRTDNCQVISELTGELDAEKIASLKRSDPRWWTDGRIEMCRSVERWHWENALAMAGMPAELRALATELDNALIRAQGASSSHNRWRERADALQRKYDAECKRLEWSE